MKIENISVSEAISKAKKLLKEEKGLTPAFKSAIEVIFILLKIMSDRLSLNSSNSSIPPSQDPNRPKKKKKKKGKGKKKKRGGQEGHNGSTLEKVENPDEIVEINVDRRTIPPGNYTHVGYEDRQVIDIQISRAVTEYRAEILEDENGNTFVAEFPDGVTRAVQYGPDLKSQSVYMSQSQLIPYNRIEDYFEHQIGLSISSGSLVNFNLDAFKRLEDFEKWLKKKLLISELLHADETGINVDAKRIWLHSLSNEELTFFYPHLKRGTEAMNEMDILPHFLGFLCHDHWKPYFHYESCTHVLCNAHHLRELERAWEQDDQRWAKLMMDLLEEINNAVKKAKGILSEDEVKGYQKRYRTILTKGEKECPAPKKEEGKKGKAKKSKARNLLERLRDFEEDTLMFMKIKIVPFTNNQSENDLRMTKVQQKISGCFRSMEGAKVFCRIRSYLSTSKKNGVAPTEALKLLFKGKLPSFVTQNHNSS